MKKHLSIVVLTVFVGSLMAAVASDMAFAATKAAMAPADSLKAQISKVEAKIKVTKNKAAKAKLQAQLKALKAKWAAWQAAQLAPMAPAPAPSPDYVAPSPAPAPQYVAPKPSQPWVAAKTAEWELNGNLGLVAGILGLKGGLRYNIPQSWFGMSGWSVEGGGGFATGTISGKTQRIVDVYGDAVYALPAEWTGGIETYAGAGLNFPVRAAGKTGQIGGTVYYGAQTADPFGMGGKMYGQVGYEVLRGKAGTGISQKSVSALVGWRYPLAF